MTARTSAIAIALILCGSSLYAAETRNIDKTLPLSARGAVTLDVHNGSIQVRTWDRAEIEIHVRLEAGGTSADDRRRLDETTVEIDGSSDLVSIKARTPESDPWSWWFWLGRWGGPIEIHYTITAPRTARWTIRDHNASADIRDVNAPLHVDTHNGSVWVANLGGPLDLTTHNGNAHVDFASFTHDSRVDTHNGTVELALPASSKFALHASGHHIHVASDFRDSAGGPDLRLTSHNGSFRLRSK